MAKTYTLKGLNEKLQDFEGAVLKVNTLLEKCPNCGFVNQENSFWTIADALMNVLAKHVATGTKDDFVVYQLGLDISKYKGGILDLQEHPFNILKGVIDEFKGMTIQVMVPLRKCLELAEDEVEVDKALDKVDKKLVGKKDKVLEKSA